MNDIKPVGSGREATRLLVAVTTVTFSKSTDSAKDC
jgi:hypothetical protein